MTFTADRVLVIAPLGSDAHLLSGLLLPMSRGASVTHAAPGADLGELVEAIAPTIVVGGPAVADELERQIEERLEQMPPRARALWRDLAERHAKVREALGGRVAAVMYAPVRRGGERGGAGIRGDGGVRGAEGFPGVVRYWVTLAERIDDGTDRWARLCALCGLCAKCEALGRSMGRSTVESATHAMRIGRWTRCVGNYGRISASIPATQPPMVPALLFSRKEREERKERPTDEAGGAMSPGDLGGPGPTMVAGG